jgi:hypothetical protein
MPKMTKFLATAVTALALAVSAPGAALADVENIWSRWYQEVTTRDKPEIPFAILFSLPAMIFSTPFWAGMIAVEKISGDD